MIDSNFLSENLIGKPIPVMCKDPVDCGTVPGTHFARSLPDSGIVGEGGGDQHFFPWTEVVEISASPGSVDDGELVSAGFADSEP